MMELPVHSIDKDFVVIDPDKAASIEGFDSTLFQRLGENYNGFHAHELVSCFEFSEDWSTWEMHPHGDEVIILLSGAATFVLEVDSEEKSVFLEREGSYIVVPRGVWHTARTNKKAKLLFITPGEGTQNKES